VSLLLLLLLLLHRPALLCHCRLAQHFSSLQALWLEHVLLPLNLLPAALPSAAATLESLALLHVSGERTLPPPTHPPTHPPSSRS
jgi:hypothetical protein